MILLWWSILSQDGSRSMLIVVTSVGLWTAVLEIVKLMRVEAMIEVDEVRLPGPRRPTELVAFQASGSSH